MRLRASSSGSTRRITTNCDLIRIFPSNGCRTYVHPTPRLSRSPPTLNVIQYQLLQTDLIKGAVLATSFTTVSIETPAYLPYLLARFLARGGSIIKNSLQHISQVLEGALTPFKPDALVVCAGIGARSLGGVEDRDVFPVRGQTVLIRAPWVKLGQTINGKDDLTYIIPRRSGNVSGTVVHSDSKIELLRTGSPRWNQGRG